MMTSSGDIQHQNLVEAVLSLGNLLESYQQNAFNKWGSCKNIVKESRIIDSEIDEMLILQSKLVKLFRNQLSRFESVEASMKECKELLQKCSGTLEDCMTLQEKFLLLATSATPSLQNVPASKNSSVVKKEPEVTKPAALSANSSDPITVDLNNLLTPQDPVALLGPVKEENVTLIDVNNIGSLDSKLSVPVSSDPTAYTLPISDNAENVPGITTIIKKEQDIENAAPPPHSIPEAFSMDAIVNNVLDDSSSLLQTALGVGGLHPLPQLTNVNFHQRYACDVCRRRFSTATGLKKHACLKERTCTICAALFDNGSRLRAHCAAVHGVDLSKPSDDATATPPKKARKLTAVCVHSCEICGKEFDSRSGLDLHNCLAGVRCSKCKKSFSDEQCLSVHMANSHKSFSCPLCGVSFSRKHRLNSHIAQQHPS